MPKHYNYLTREQRCQIRALKTTALSQRQIDLGLGVSPSTISRELKRNQGRKGYRFQQADTLATERRHAASAQPTCMTPDNIRIIEKRLEEGWSPDQISGRLKLEGICVSHESIYHHVWSDKQQGGFLYRHLRYAGKKYNRRSSGRAGRGCIPNHIDIKERPAIVEKNLKWVIGRVIRSSAKNTKVPF